MEGRLAAASRALVGLAGTGVVLVALHAAGGVLPTPPLDPGGLPGWVRARDPLTGVIGLLRLVALASGWYLAAVSTLLFLAGVTRAAGVVRISRLVTTPGARRAAHAVLGASLLTALSVPPALAGVPVGAAPPPSAAHEPAELPAPPGDADRGAWLVDALEALGGHPPASAPAQRPPPTDTRTGASVDEHVVRHGESFWSIAVDVTGPEVDSAALTAYWRRLVAANRDRLVDPADPDLIHPGQRMVVPPVSPPPGGQR